MEEVVMCGVVLGFILGDVVGGYLAAVKSGTVSSSRMREGLFKKAGSVLLMLTSLAVEHVGIYVGIDSGVCEAVAWMTCGLLAVMELTSIVENICKLNPDLPIAKVFAIFGLEGHDGEVQD